MSVPNDHSSGPLPYKIAVLCDLRDRQGRILLIKRAKDPNKGLYSPIGGKLDTASGESPAMCARREILEEAGIDVPLERLHLGGIISEQAYQGTTHWLMFWYRALGSVEVREHEIREGSLEWHPIEALAHLPQPESDRRVIWPLVRQHDAARAGARPGFFCVHVDCTGKELTWDVQQSEPPRNG